MGLLPWRAGHVRTGAVRTALLALVTVASCLAGGAAWAQPATWNFTAARVAPAQTPGRGGAGVVVAIVDTWVDAAHPSFRGRVLDGADCAGGGCRAGRAAPDSCEHGTHVAGTVASADYGVAPSATILPVRVLTDGGSAGGTCSGSTADVANGIVWAYQHGAAVINLSLGGLVPLLTQDSGVTAAVRAAAAAGVLVVFAAGNSSIPVTDNYGSDALIVAATGPNGSLASYSQSGPSVALAAPGGDSGSGGCDPSTCVLSTLPHGAFGLLEGTSMAAPHVSGTAALLLGQNPGRGRVDVVSVLRSTARPLLGAGSGALDAEAALAQEPPPGARPAPAPPAGSAGAPSQAPGTPAPRGGPAQTVTLPPLPAPLVPVPPTDSPAAGSPASPAAAGVNSPAPAGPGAPAAPTLRAAGGSGHRPGAGLIAVAVTVLAGSATAAVVGLRRP